MADAAGKQRDYFGLTAGLSGTQIKIIAVIMMVFDHLYQIFHVHGIPQWFNWIGRPVAPVFLFICAEGFIHTRSRKRYLLQLLAGFELMQIISSVLTFALPNDDVIRIAFLYFTAPKDFTGTAAGSIWHCPFHFGQHRMAHHFCGCFCAII